jgi:hypothetical protein
VKVPRVPMELAGGVAHFSDLLLSLEAIRGRDAGTAEELLALVPASLRESPCFLDRMTKIWLYDFGEPVLTSGGVTSGVDITFHPLTRLVDVVECARARLSESDLTNYLGRLADPNKHADMLFEFAPILRLDRTTAVDYEAAGEGPGNSRIDWRISDTNGFSVLLEVKRRQTDLIQGFKRVQAGELDDDGRVLPPEHDTDLLFRSVESKFNPRILGELAQGVWIGSGLMQERKELEASFLRLDPSRVHFAVLGTWAPAAHILVREEALRPRLVELLQLREDDGLVLDRLSSA